MSQDNVERLLGRLITDSDFAETCRESLESACMKRGLSMTELEMAAVRETDIDQVASLSPTLDDRIKRAAKTHKEGEE